MSSLKPILVAGATGKQGGALIKALLATNNPPKFSIIALTRDPNSQRSKSLAAQPNVSVIEGNFDDPAAIFRKINQPLYGVYSVQTPFNAKAEERQGKALIDAAAAHGVKHFVYASVDRGGPAKSDVDPTPVPHLASKFRIENHLKEVAKSMNIGWTIIRPVAFMDNFTPDFIGRAMATMVRQNGPDSKLQYVYSRDIGTLAAAAFQNPQKYGGRALSLAGDELTWTEFQEVWRRVFGTDVPVTYGWLATVIKWVLHEQLGLMVKWFKTDGYGADVNEFRDEIPNLMKLEDWLKTESGFKHLAK